MEITHKTPQKRTWIFFFLILLVGMLWAHFLLIRGEMVQVSFLIAILAIFISLFSFLYHTEHRTWIFFYLIILVAVLWASFLLMKGAMIWVSTFLFIVAGGTTIFSFVFIGQETAAPQDSGQTNQ